MNFADAFSNILAKLGGFDSKFDALSEQIANLKQENGSATADIEAKNAEIADLKAKLAEAPTATALAEVTENLAAKTKEFDDYKAAEPKRINAALVDEISKFGVPPITPRVEGKTSETKNLTGLAKVTAAFKSKTQK